MNYAEDRLDRKARGSGLWKDYCDALDAHDHGMLGRTLRDVGWIRHAAFHYSCSGDLGDYAQMAELSGFPEVGILALLHYRNVGSFTRAEWARAEICEPPIDELWLQQAAPQGHCGCGLSECGRNLCNIPMVGLGSIIDSLQAYVELLPSRKVPSAHEILTAQAKNEVNAVLDTYRVVPQVLRFWDDGGESPSNICPLTPVLKLLLLKLLYLVIPPLAAEAVVHLKVDQRAMARDFKSHNAYYVLIQAVVLGERIKPHRRRTLPLYHIPVWDALWGHANARRGSYSTQRVWHCSDAQSHFQAVLQACRTCQSFPPLLVSATTNPLVVMGDSHVLSCAWQTIQYDGEIRTLFPVIITGLKAWHCRSETRFFTQSLLHVMIRRLPYDVKQEIIFSAGEIDCREGLGGPKLEGYTAPVDESYVIRTVEAYVRSLADLGPRIWVMPVCPHLHRSQRNGKRVGRATRRQTMQIWNEQLRRHLPLQGVALLDYEQDLVEYPAYELKKELNADGTHMNSAFLPFLEKARIESKRSVTL